MKLVCLLILGLLGPISALNLNETSQKDLLKYVLNQGNVLDMVKLLRNDIDREFFAELTRQGWSEEKIIAEFKEPSPRDEDYLEQLIAYDPTTRYIFDEIAKYFKTLGVERDIAIRILGSLTPIFGVPGLYPLSKECSDASWTYLANMFLSTPEDQEIQFAISMFDSSGKIPDGIYADSYEFCERLEKFYAQTFGFTCDSGPPEGVQLPFSLSSLRGLINIPYGNTKAYGSFPGCINVKKEFMFGDLHNPYNISHIYGQYVRLSIDPNFGKISGDDAKETRLAGIIAAGGLVKPIIDQVFNSSEILSSAKTLYQFIVQASFLTAEFGWAQCVPDACTPADITTSASIMLDGAGPMTSIISKVLTDENKREELDTFAKAMIVIFGIIGYLMVLGSLIDVWDHVNPFPPKIKAKLMPIEMLKSFSIVKNGNIILSTATGKGHLNCLTGMRSISMCWIIYGHLYLLGQYLGFSKSLENRKLVEEIALGKAGTGYLILLNAFPAVDTFFFMSGTLVAYLTFPAFDKRKFDLAMFYIHRYIRLTIPLAFYIAFEAAFAGYMTYGPLFDVSAGRDHCRNTGWRNILYINNFFNFGDACLGQTWYLANDMQFYILSPFIMYPIWKKPKYGIMGALTIYALLTLLIGAITYEYQIPPSNGFPYSQPADFDMATHFYAAPYIRFQPYLIGILLGYLLYKTKSKEVRIPHGFNIVMWQLSLLTMYVVIFGISTLLEDDTPTGHSWNSFQSIMYNCFSKTGWSLALAWIVFSCHKGYGGVVNSFLSWKAWIPLSKLTYGAYLIHITCQQIVLFGSSYALHFTDFMMSVYFIGTACFVFGASFVLSLSVELPFVHLEKMLLGGAARKPQQQPQENKEESEPVANGNVKEKNETSKEKEAEEKHPKVIEAEQSEKS